MLYLSFGLSSFICLQNKEQDLSTIISLVAVWHNLLIFYFSVTVVSQDYSSSYPPIEPQDDVANQVADNRLIVA